MNRSKSTPDEQPEQTPTDPGPEPTVAAATEAGTDDTATRYEPYPGVEFFHGGRHSPIVTAMARRLEAEGCTDGRYLGPDWTNAHRDAFARFQHQLRPKEGGDVSGIPDRVAWERLQVPRVSPLPREA
ncbi:peptidoglycan-binding protein [Streptomyces collinus]|uniref:peptidoglycan-binding protein n=1 Tax=Streptomyces collinus TaxID=42684 RepID=UPI003819CC69